MAGRVMSVSGEEAMTIEDAANEAGGTPLL
jgi:hypothetical protein